jgi:integration host factor subunit alpha
MSLGKKDISINISTKAQISISNSNSLLNFFLTLIKDNSKNKAIKISNFGTFSYKDTPQRLGRNPKTRENFIISKRAKLYFKPSNNIKSTLN